MKTPPDRILAENETDEQVTDDVRGRELGGSNQARLRSLVLIFVGFIAGAARADVTLAPLFRDGAVLQRDKPVPVWGKASPGEAVQVRFGTQTLATTAGVDGRWKVTLAQMAANATPAELFVSGRNALRVADILVGEVWLCSGQSNMNWSVADAKDAAAEISGARNPLIRYFGVANVGAEMPADTTEGAWKRAAPENVGAFSAVAYFFARELQPKLGVPLGLVKGTPGGSSIEAWMSGEALAADPTFPLITERWEKAQAGFPQTEANYRRTLADWETEAAAAKAAARPFEKKRPAAPQPPSARGRPAGLFNSNIHPFIPYAIRGILWYQGEGNASRFDAYGVSFPAMIQQWRRDFGQGDLPFFFVQLANFDLENDSSHQQWAFQREAQTRALILPQTAMAVTIDIGEPKDIHPRNKQEVGRRLALLARNRVYAEKLASDSPQALRFTSEAGVMRVQLIHAGGLTVRGEKVLDLQIAGADREFHPADAKITGDTLQVSSPEVPAPVAVRYLWRNAPAATLFNEAGLPVAPFRSDTW